MTKKRKSKKLKECEEDLMFYLEYYNQFTTRFQGVANKEIDDLIDKIKKG